MDVVRYLYISLLYDCGITSHMFTPTCWAVILQFFVADSASWANLLWSQFSQLGITADVKTFCFQTVLYSTSYHSTKLSIQKPTTTFFNVWFLWAFSIIRTIANIAWFELEQICYARLKEEGLHSVWQRKTVWTSQQVFPLRHYYVPLDFHATLECYTNWTGKHW